ncbi:hypothetical protein Tco_1034519, partial [Tanacetum coccineum]
KIDKGKGIKTKSDDDPSKKLVKASSIVRPDPDEPEEAEKIGLDPKAIKCAKAGEMFKKSQDAEHVILKRQHTKKVIKSLELRKHKYDSYMWTISSRLKLEPITDIKIHSKTKTVVITVTLSLWCICRRYERLKKILEELGIHSALPAPVPKQASSRSSRRKQKHMALEPKTRIPGLEYNRALPENAPFVNNMVIEETCLVGFVMTYLLKSLCYVTSTKFQDYYIIARCLLFKTYIPLPLSLINASAMLLTLKCPIWGCDRLVSRAKVIENQVMDFSVILISSDSSKESVGTSTARVILFGTIPATISPSTPTTDLLVIHDDTLLTPFISPTIPIIPLVAPTIQYTSPFINTDSSNNDTSDSPPS